MNQVQSKVIKAKSKKVLGVLITYCILIIVAFIFLFPCLWLILASFSKSGSIYSFDGFFPAEYGFDAFKSLFTDTVMYNYPKWFFNTLCNELYSRNLPYNPYGVLYVKISF